MERSGLRLEGLRVEVFLGEDGEATSEMGGDKGIWARTGGNDTVFDAAGKLDSCPRVARVAEPLTRCKRLLLALVNCST